MKNLMFSESYSLLIFKRKLIWPTVYKAVYQIFLRLVFCDSHFCSSIRGRVLAQLIFNFVLVFECIVRVYCRVHKKYLLYTDVESAEKVYNALVEPIPLFDSFINFDVYFNHIHWLVCSLNILFTRFKVWEEEVYTIQKFYLKI